ncbi:lysis system i-spanin subunit Rz [Comamonas terrigena]|uniref:lysis system i-spanin subunit Rz n=1 Tax=Comamonas terrigena TaxID=32013 RepID=UPI00244BE528|nr:lysis system i-spanin subunit Rz [Comamonas terrigena]MDH0048595.1 lysis protein [Comamonas terrigena]MDH0511575.1 lysis protein [Comamonas terrigena]MDH1090966.1 lysis protein [Comamonas terrigena]
MNRTAWIGLAKLIAVGALVGLALAAFNNHGRQQYQAGRQDERNNWLQRDNEALRIANGRIATLQQEARDKERAHGQAMDGIAAQHQKDLKDARTEKDRVIADLRARNLRLRIPVVTTASAACRGGGAGSEAGPSTGQRDGEATAELSDAAAEFLVGLASEADDVARQLSACQAVVIADRQQQEGQ